MNTQPTIEDAALSWWALLTDQETIIAALEAVEYHQHPDRPTYVAEKPWKWMEEAFALQPQAECYVCTHLREQHERDDCEVEDCDCRDFQPFPTEKAAPV